MTYKPGALRLPAAAVAALALAAPARSQTHLGPAADSPGAAAERLTYGVDAGLGETDNVGLSSSNRVAQTIATVDADFDIKHRSSRYDVEAKGNFYDFDYLQSAYGNQLLGRFDGLAHVALIPQKITWVVADDFGQAALDPFVPTTPGNLEDINFFSTGPDFALRLGGTGFLDAGARVSRATYQTSPFNSNRALASVGAGVQLSPRSSVSLNGAAERVLFENTVVNGDFTRESGYLRYEIQGARTGISLDLGVSGISQNASAGTSTVVFTPAGKPITVPVTIPQSAYRKTGPLARVALSRKLTSASSLTLTAGRELTDGTSSFNSVHGGAIGPVDIVPAQLTSSSYTSTSGGVGWRYERNRTTVGLSGFWQKEVYVSQPQFDLTRAGLEVDLARKLSRDFALQVTGRYDKSDYKNGALLAAAGGSPKYDDALAAAILSWRHGRALEVRLRAEHSLRSTPGINEGYSENRVFLTVGYRPFAPHPADAFRPLEEEAPADRPGLMP